MHNHPNAEKLEKIQYSFMILKNFEENVNLIIGHLQRPTANIFNIVTVSVLSPPPTKFVCWSPNPQYLRL